MVDNPIRYWSVHPDGKRFLVVQVLGGTKLIIATNWLADVREKLDAAPH